MASFILWSVAIVMMFTGINCIATSQSCSTVNGQTVCQSQQSNGNIAGSSSSAFSGGQGFAQQTSVATGNTGTSSFSSSSSSQGNFFPFPVIGLANPFQAFGGGAFAIGRR